MSNKTSFNFKYYLINIVIKYMLGFNRVNYQIKYLYPGLNGSQSQYNDSLYWQPVLPP